jgi:Leucine-rich repeat (LRR) protein
MAALLDPRSVNALPVEFQGLSDLELISVQNNPINRLQGFSFAGLRNVSNLHLGHNQISKIEG